MQYAKYTNTISGRSILLLIILVFLAGCSAPFSDLQSAKLVGKGKAEITPSFSSVYMDSTDTRHVQNHLGLQTAYGMSDKVDFRLRFERISIDKDGEEPVNVIGFGPKIGIVEDTLALNLPFGFALHDNADISKSWEFHPTLLLTLISGNLFEVNTSAKALIPLNRENAETLVAFNLGTGISTNMEKWAIRPELGLLLNPGEDGHFMQFSIGLTIYP